MLYREYNRQQLEAGFEKTGNFVDFQDWTKQAQTARDTLVQWMAANPSPPPKTKPPVEAEIYGALKGSLRKYFQDKCAYCDSLFAVVDWGDVDHYRPKLRVAGNKQHRGYYWLAYDDSNLLPACPVCNRGGKRDLFPVDPANANVVAPGGNLNLEHPLLLRPYDPTLKDPNTHFSYELREVDGPFGRELLPTGWIEGVTPQAEASIEAYDLNRKPLRDRRAANQQIAILRLEASSKDILLQAALKDLLDTKVEHSMAVLVACMAYNDFRHRLNVKRLQERRP